MSNIYGRQVILPLTNKSGGQVIAGDVVVVDTTNNDAFTTSTAGAVTITIGVAQETIANNATGRVLTAGYAALVNTNASVTRGNYGKTYTVAKQATDAGASRVAGTFCQFLTGGTTPDAMVYPVDLAGAALTNPMTTKGDVILGDTGGAPTRLAAGATAGMVLTSAGSGAFETFSLPPGYQIDYTEITSSVNVTAVDGVSFTTIITGGSVAYDGSTKVNIEFYSEAIQVPNIASLNYIFLVLFDGASQLGTLTISLQANSTSIRVPCFAGRQLTPSNASHQYIVKAAIGATGTGIVYAGNGASGNPMPAYLRITKA